MEKDLFLMLIALVISAVTGIDLFRTVAVLDVAYRLIRLLMYAYIQTREDRHRKSPSRSAKRNGRLHH